MEEKKYYVGVKALSAVPMSRGEYNAYRGWKVPENEDPSDAGYLVEYLDGGKPNHPDHVGYISWSPAEQFEAAYLPAPSQEAAEQIIASIKDGVKNHFRGQA